MNDYSDREISQLKREHEDLKVIRQKTKGKLTIEQQEYQNLYRLLDLKTQLETQLAQEQEKIKHLEIRINEFNQLISEQQTKLGKDCLRFFNEEEHQLIQE